MRTVFFAALLGSSVFITATTAQEQPQVTPPFVPEGEAEAKAAISECGRLLNFLEQARPANPGVTPEQVRGWQQNARPQPCQENLRRLTENASAPSDAPPQASAMPSQGQNATTGTPTASEQVVVQQAQPNVTVSQPQGQATASSPTQQAAQAQLNTDQRGSGTAGSAGSSSDGPAQTGALTSPGLQAVKASDLEKMALYNARDEKMGEVENVLIGPDNKTYIVIGHGGFLGLGEKHVALSSDQIAMRGDRLVAESLTDEQIRAFPEFKESANFKEMDGDQTTSLRLAQ